MTAQINYWIKRVELRKDFNTKREIFTSFQNYDEKKLKFDSASTRKKNKINQEIKAWN